MHNSNPAAKTLPTYLERSRLPSLSPSPVSLPTPPQESPSERFKMPPTRRREVRRASPRPSRAAASSSAPRYVDDEDSKPETKRMMVLEPDASPEKYWHHFDRLSNPEVGEIQECEHSINCHPDSKMKTWEYTLPEHMWPPLKENAKNQDPTLKFRWGRENGYVLFTNIAQALKSNLKVSELLRGHEHTVCRVRGGQIAVQGSWIPYDVCRNICLERCYDIRAYLEPMFGPEFVEDCLPPVIQNEPGRPRPGRRPRNPRTQPVRKRPSVDIEDEVDSERETTPPRKRRELRPATPMSIITPPPFPSDLNLDKPGFDALSVRELCDIFEASRTLHELKYSPNGPWPAPNDERWGGEFRWKGHRWYWNGKDLPTRMGVDQSLPARPSALPSFKDFVQKAPSTPYDRLPISPSPFQSPFQPNYEWRAPVGADYISPPMSLREDFSMPSRERQESFLTTDECRTPTTEHYAPLFFPTPQPESS